MSAPNPVDVILGVSKKVGAKAKATKGKGPKRTRKRTTKEQLAVLGAEFANGPHPDSNKRHELAKQLGMTPRGVQIWFQNRRAKEKNSKPTAEVIAAMKYKPKGKAARRSGARRRRAAAAAAQKKIAAGASVDDNSNADWHLPAEQYDVNSQKNAQGATLLFAFSSLGYEREVTELLGHNADPNMPDAEGNTALITACTTGHANIVSILLQNNADVNKQNNFGVSPVYAAAKAGNAYIVDLLLQHKAAVNVAEHQSSESPLHVAATKGYDNIVHSLLKSGATVSNQDRVGYTALHHACVFGHENVVRYLLQFGATLDARDSNGHTPLHCACLGGNTGVAALLLAAGAAPALTDKHGTTALHYAAREGHQAVAELLLSRDTTLVTLAASNGYTPLHMAAREKSLAMIQLLLDQDAVDVNARSKKGYTVLHLATLEGITAVVSLLRTHGADPEIADNAGRPPRMPDFFGDGGGGDGALHDEDSEDTDDMIGGGTLVMFVDDDDTYGDDGDTNTTTAGGGGAASAAAQVLEDGRRVQQERSELRAAEQRLHELQVQAELLMVANEAQAAAINEIAGALQAVEPDGDAGDGDGGGGGGGGGGMEGLDADTLASKLQAALRRLQAKTEGGGAAGGGADGAVTEEILRSEVAAHMAHERDIDAELARRADELAAMAARERDAQRVADESMYAGVDVERLGEYMPVLVFTYNRENYLRRTLESVMHTLTGTETAVMERPETDDEHARRIAQQELVYTRSQIDYGRMTVKGETVVPRTADPHMYPLIVSQDGTHPAIPDVVAEFAALSPWRYESDERYVDADSGEVRVHGVTREARRVFHFMQRRNRELPAEALLESVNLHPYYHIALHYKHALTQVFDVYGFHQVIILEDDMQLAPDFFEYFRAMLPLLRSDPTLFAASAWNDHGQAANVRDADGVFRTNFFPGLGWLMTRELWAELGPKWPLAYWDDWMRLPSVIKYRDCIRPEMPRTYTFGEIGSSMGQFYQIYLKPMRLADQWVPWTRRDLSFLHADRYDEVFARYLDGAVAVADPAAEFAYADATLVYVYRDFRQFENMANRLSMMPDEKSGVLRASYYGVVVLHRGSNTVLFAHESIEDVLAGVETFAQYATVVKSQRRRTDLEQELAELQATESAVRSEVERVRLRRMKMREEELRNNPGAAGGGDGGGGGGGGGGGVGGGAQARKYEPHVNGVKLNRVQG